MRGEKSDVKIGKPIPLASVSPKLQALARRVLKLERKAMALKITIDEMLEDYLPVVKMSVQELIQEEQREREALSRVQAPKQKLKP